MSTPHIAQTESRTPGAHAPIDTLSVLYFSDNDRDKQKQTQSNKAQGGRGEKYDKLKGFNAAPQSKDVKDGKLFGRELAAFDWSGGAEDDGGGRQVAATTTWWTRRSWQRIGDFVHTFRLELSHPYHDVPNTCTTDADNATEGR